MLVYAIYQRTEVYNSVLQKIATDIGVPCTHPNLVRWQSARQFAGILHANFAAPLNIEVGPGLRKPVWTRCQQTHNV